MKTVTQKMPTIKNMNIKSSLQTGEKLDNRTYDFRVLDLNLDFKILIIDPH